MMESILLTIWLIVIVLILAVLGVIIPFMIQIDICGSNNNHDL